MLKDKYVSCDKAPKAASGNPLIGIALLLRRSVCSAFVALRSPGGSAVSEFPVRSSDMSIVVLSNMPEGKLVKPQ